MGESKQKREAEERRRREEAQRRAEERAKWSTPKKRRGWRGVEVTITVSRPRQPPEHETYVYHEDGTVYFPGLPTRRVKDREIVEAVRARVKELRRPVVPAQSA